MAVRLRWVVPTLALAAVSGATATAAPTFNPINGHYYDLINTTITWTAANTAATSSVFLGVPGHLVTITDAAENLWLTDTFTADGLHLHWTGGLQPVGSAEPDGGWSWATGEVFGFANWEPGEPNDTDGAEDRIAFDHGVSDDGKAWNDLPAGMEIDGYIVEYDTNLGTTAPEPATLALLGVAALGFPLTRRRAR